MNDVETRRDDTEMIRDALRHVYDPEIGMSVVDLGMIRDIDVGEDQVEIRMILTSPFCPLASLIVSQVQKAAESAIDLPVNVSMGTEPWDPSMMRQE
jgi:metal-sulfur cluster biosynthetic enzyme